MESVRKLRLFAVSLAGTLAVAACGGDSGPSSSTTISQAQATVIGAEAASQIGGLAGGLTSFTSGSVSGGFFAPARPGGLVFARLRKLAPAGVRLRLALLASPDSACVPTISGDTLDTDGDGIPNGASYTFTAGNCSYGDSTGSVVITGGISLVDTDSPTTLFGYDFTLNNFSVTATDSNSQNNSINFVVDGTQLITVTSATAVAAENVSFRYAVNGTNYFTFASDWSTTFTPTSGQIDPTNGPLQAGAFTVGGSYDWDGRTGTNADGNWKFTLATTAPLQYDGQCTDPDYPLESGTLQGAINGNQQVGFTVDFQGCGTLPTITAYDTTP